MKYTCFLLFILVILSSCNKKIVLLPEIKNASITEVIDVSPVYMFYDEVNDSIEINRKNLISTTNWLVNIDKRLTLNQVLPHLKYLQEKRHGHGMHKNESARNYFTCNDTSNKNLGFIEFTDVVYIDDINKNSSGDNPDNTIIDFTKNNIIINDKSIKIEDLKIYLTGFNKIESDLVLSFNSSLTFQDYIHYKYFILELNLPNVSISNEEFIY